MDMARLNFAHGDPDEHAETARADPGRGRAGGTRGGDPRRHPGTQAAHRAGGRRGRGRARPRHQRHAHLRGRGRQLRPAAGGLGAASRSSWTRATCSTSPTAPCACACPGSGRRRGHPGRGRRQRGIAPGPQPAERDGLAAGRERRGHRARWTRASTWESTTSRCRSCAAARTSTRCASTCARAARDIPLIAKVEKPQAAANAEEIVDAADGIMVARGDLGIELPIEEVPLVQKRLLALAGRRAKPTITATQMLESMVHSTRPTRAEVADVANAIFDGTDAVMLSQETAVGRHPIARGGDDGQHRGGHGARAALRALARRARTAGEQPVPRDRLRGRGRRLPARPQGAS